MGQSEQGPTAVAQRLLSSPWVADFLSPAQSALTSPNHDGYAKQLPDQEHCSADCEDAQSCSHGELDRDGAQVQEPAVIEDWQLALPRREQQEHQPCQTEPAETRAEAQKHVAAQVMPDQSAACVQQEHEQSQPDRSDVMELSDPSTAGGAAAVQPFGKHAGCAQRNWTMHGEIRCTCPVRAVSAGSTDSSGPASLNHSGAFGNACDMDAPIPAAQHHEAAQGISSDASEHEDGPGPSDLSEAASPAASTMAHSDSCEHE